MRAACLAVIAATMLLAAPADAAAEQPGPACDRLASHPYDPLRAADGVLFDDLDAAAAEAACRAAVAAHPEEPRYAYQLGRVLHVKQDLDGARQSYQAALAADYAMALFGLGVLHEDLPEPDFQEAAALYTQAADRGVSAAWRNLATLHELGSGMPQDYAEAARLYRLAAAEGDPAAAIALGDLHAAGFGVARDIAEAERLYRLAIDNTIDRSAAADGRNALAWTWAEAGMNLQDAETLANEALQAYPEEPSYLDTRGWIRFRLDRPEEALHDLEQAVALDPEYAASHDRLGDVYAALGRHDEAKAHWQRALELPSPEPLYEPDWDAAAIARKISGAN
jgi:TPR repeat protein